MKPEQTECAIEQAAAVVGDWWSLLIVRDVASGIHRFDELQAELQISRRVLSERLSALVETGVLERTPYQARPPRHEYRLTASGLGLLPVLIALQDWGARWLAGDGTLSATTGPRSAEATRVRALEGRRIGELANDPIAPEGWTVAVCFPGAYVVPSAYPPGWDEIEGAPGCTVELAGFRDHLPDFAERGARVVGISTQRSDEQAALAKRQKLRFPLFSDQEMHFAAALRLPTFRAGGVDRLKRLTLVVDGERTIRRVLYPVVDPASAAMDALDTLARLPAYPALA